MKHLKTLNSILALTAATTSFADDFKHEFTVGADWHKCGYREKFETHLTTQDWMTLKSNQFGVNGAYKFTYNDWLFVQPEVRVSYGLAKYEGDGSPFFPTMSKPTLLFESRILGGVQYKPIDTFALSPYVGIGYRRISSDGTLTNHANSDSSNKSVRVAMWWYMATGIDLKYDFADKWFIKGRYEFDYLLSNSKTFSYNENSCPSPKEFRQRGWGQLVEGQIGHTFDNGVTLAVGPYYKYWKIKRSPDVEYKMWTRGELQGKKLWLFGETHEPKNYTHEFGIKATFTF